MRIDHAFVVGWLTALVSVSGLVPALAQDAAAEEPTPAASAAVSPTAPSVRRLERIARGLRQPVPDAAGPALRLDVGLHVVGAAPSPVPVAAADVAIGTPVYGAPTHDEVLTQWTPRALRSTAAYRRFRPAVPLGR